MVNKILLLEITLVVLINQPSKLIAVPSISLCSSPVQNQICILKCSESSVSFPVIFEHPSGKIQGSCPVVGDNSLCVSANYTTYQSVPVTYLNISSLDKSRDEGDWRCLHGSASSETLKLYVSSPQRTQEIPQVTITETEIKITCAMLCQYPTTTISVELLYAEEGTSNYTPFPSTPTLTIDSADSSGCENYESNYKAKFTFTKSDDLSTVLDKKITCKCNFTQSIIQTSEDTGTVSASFVFKFKYEKTTTTTNPPEKRQSKDKEIGIGIGIGASCFFIIVGGVGYVYKRKKKDRTQQRKDKESQGTLTQNVDKSNNLENKPT